MNKVLLGILVVFGLASLAWLLFGFFGVQYAFIDNEVDDDISFLENTEPREAILPSDNENEVREDVNENNSFEEEAELAVEPQIQFFPSGIFEQGDSTYSISGNALTGDDNGETSLAFTDFNVSNGPDLFVYLVRTDDYTNQGVKDAVSNGDYIDLGDLKGNIGNQKYTVFDDIDLSEYDTVSIWCRQFGRNFGFARLR